MTVLGTRVGRRNGITSRDSNPYVCKPDGWMGFAYMGGCFIPSIADYAMLCVLMEAISAHSKIEQSTQ